MYTHTSVYIFACCIQPFVLVLTLSVNVETRLKTRVTVFLYCLHFEHLKLGPQILVKSPETTLNVNTRRRQMALQIP